MSTSCIHHVYTIYIIHIYIYYTHRTFLLAFHQLPARYNRLFQQLLTYRHATMRLQHLQLGAEEERGRLAAALKAQLCFFWTQVPWEPWEKCGVSHGGYPEIIWNHLFLKGFSMINLEHFGWAPFSESFICSDLIMIHWDFYGLWMIMDAYGWFHGILFHRNERISRDCAKGSLIEGRSQWGIYGIALYDPPSFRGRKWSNPPIGRWAFICSWFVNWNIRSVF